MTNKSYLKGSKFEHEVMRYLESKGYYVTRNPKSKFPDLISVKEASPSAIECKYNGYLSSTERGLLINLARKYGLSPIWACRFKFKREIIFKLVGNESKEDVTIKL